MKIQFKYIKPPDLNVQVFRDYIGEELQRQAKQLIQDYNLTTRTWNDKPEFTAEIDNTSRSVSLRVGTDSEIYKYVDQGTKVRWALMSGNWKSKTRPGVIGSTGGRGRVILIGKRRMRKPRPGIKARKFSQNIKLIRSSGFERAMQKVFQRGAKDAWRY